MITVNKLTKVYYGTDKKSLTALKNISFSLPDKGLVFITGKSGSGKSTLLNMLGGLDSITKGDIIADGNRFSTFTPNDFNRYRNSYIGFIFQDYCLIEDLTIYQNIELVLDLNRRHDKSIINYILSKVGLPNCANRYPRELSGGQKQRVAIARALAKEPQLFLADEPTGNLDRKTARQIMTILKDLSKTKLVVVVSHNLEDAEEYGDRIIELEDGTIIRDEEKLVGYQDKLELINGKLILPRHKELSQEEIQSINKWYKTSQIHEFDQRQEGFYPSNNDYKSNKVVHTTQSKLSFAKAFSLAWKFLKRRQLNFIFTSLIITCIVAVLGICQFFVAFDYNTAINDAVLSENQSLIIGYKSRFLDNDYKILDYTFIHDITDSEIKLFDECEYNGGYYKVYNDALHIAGASQLLRQEVRINHKTNLANFYPQESYGTLVCDEQYLLSTFGIDGKLNVIGDLNDKPYGIIITDYLADALLYFYPDKYLSYEDVLGTYYELDGMYNHYINAIIITNYNQTLGAFKNNLMYEYQSVVSQNKPTNIYNQDIFTAFASDVEKYLGIAYSINPNYHADTITIDAKNYTRLDYTTATIPNTPSSPAYIENMVGYWEEDNPYIDIELDAGNIAMSIKTYNYYFGTNYTLDNFADYSGGSTINIAKHRRTNPTSSPLTTHQLNIVALFNSTYNAIVFDEQDLLKYREYENFDYALYFTDTQSIGGIYPVVKDSPFHINSNAFNSVVSVIDVVEIFDGFMNIINFVLLFASLLLLVAFGGGTIRKRKFEIGVIKAMGGRTRDVGKIFVIQLIAIGIVVCILSSLALLLLTNIVNSVLSSAMLVYIKNETLSKISIVQFNPLILCGDLFMILTITILSAIIPLIALRRIKPINIIKHKN